MLLGILLIAFALGLYSVIKYNFFKPEGAPPLMHSWVPFVGSIVPFGVNFLSFIEGGTKQLGKVWTTKLMGKRVTIVSHRDTHEYFFKPRNEVLSPQEVYRFMKPVFGPGVVYDATHARMREQLSFVADELSLNNMKRYVPMIQKQVFPPPSRFAKTNGEIFFCHLKGRTALSHSSPNRSRCCAFHHKPLPWVFIV